MSEERPVLLNAAGRTLLYHEVVDQAGADAPWLVFVHGAGGSIRTWKYQIEAFQPLYRLILIDLRDHGFSKDILPEFPEYDFDIVSEDILAVVDHLGIERAHFVSLSIGSVILQKIDIERPELIDRMVMAGAIFDGSRLMHWFVHSGKLLARLDQEREQQNITALCFAEETGEIVTGSEVGRIDVWSN